jgi:hypothetical protein
MKLSGYSSRTSQATVTAVVFIIFLILPICVGWFYYNNGFTLKQQVSSQLQNEENIASAAIQLKLNRLTEIASSLAVSPKIVAAVSQGNWDAAASVVRDAQNNPSFYDPYIDRMVFFDSNGVEQSAYPTLIGGIGNNASSTSWYTTAVQTDTVVVSSVVRRAATPSLNVIEIAAPVFNGNDVIGILVMQIPTDNFLDFGYALSTGTYGFTYIVDSKGNVVAHPKYSATDGVVNLASVAPVKNILAGESGEMITSDPSGNQNNFLVYEPISKYGWGIVIQEPYTEAFTAYNAMMKNMGIAEALLLVIDVLVSYLVFRFIGSRRSREELK